MQIRNLLLPGIIGVILSAGCAQISSQALPEKEWSALTFGRVGPTHAETLPQHFPLQPQWATKQEIPADIQGKVFVDTNGNGRRDQNEPGIAGIRLFLVGSRDSQYSDQQGCFAFNRIQPGAQMVVIDELTLPPGAQVTTETSLLLFLSEGADGFAAFGINK
jgi:hypothetical protein